jgi:hypothetical protein
MDLLSQITSPPKENAEKLKAETLKAEAPKENAEKLTPQTLEDSDGAATIDENDLLNIPSGENLKTETLKTETPLPDAATQPPADTGATPDGEPAPKRKRGRPPGSRTRPSFDDIAAQVTKAAVDYPALAAITFDFSTGTLSNFLGPEWQPKSPEERQMVLGPLADYFKSKQIDDIPPGVLLLAVVGVYALPRFQAPSTSQKIKPALSWVWSKFKGWWRRLFRVDKPNLTILSNTNQS